MQLSITLLAAVASACALRQAPPPAEPAAAYQHVLLISVDGLRGDAIHDTAALPGFARLRQGPHTLNARCDFDYSVTLPNHLSMVTGRSVLGVGGHFWVENDDPPMGATAHAGAGYLASIFDVAHDRGLRTAALASKSKFSLFDVSWNEIHGAPDRIGDDQGRDKIDLYLFVEDAGRITAAAREFLASGAPGLAFLHYRDPDVAGHAHGWDIAPGSAYERAVATIDRELSDLLSFVTADVALASTTAIVLTADHGGGAPREHHREADEPDNFTIPFLIWLGPQGMSADLYALNPLRADPGHARQSAARSLPPVRNGDAANLVLALLGLPGVPGATLNASQELRWR